MDKKLTDAEIVKALECCIGFDSCEERQCPMAKECDKDIDSSYKYALDLINRLQAENERLKNSNIALVNYLDVLGIDKTDTSFVQNATELNAQIRAEIKAEAYKEFAERSKEKGLQ